MNKPKRNTPIAGTVLLSSAGKYPMMLSSMGDRSTPSRQPYRRLKRVFDLLFAGIVLLPCAILSIPFVILIALETGMSPIFTQRRGLSVNGRIFSMYKFRTMRDPAEILPAGTDGVFLKPHLAGNVTRLGGFMRTTGLDELPQLLNILQGDMSLIGPRPLTVNDLEQLRGEHPELHRQRVSIQVKPGITCYWQLYGNRRNGFSDLVNHDMHYDLHCSFKTDLEIFVRTIPIIIFRKHIDSIVESRTPLQRLRGYPPSAIGRHCSIPVHGANRRQNVISTLRACACNGTSSTLP